jgi:hypothetical protein
MIERILGTDHSRKGGSVDRTDPIQSQNHKGRTCDDRWGRRMVSAGVLSDRTYSAGGLMLRKQRARAFHCDRTFQDEEETETAAASICQQHHRLRRE